MCCGEPVLSVLKQGWWWEQEEGLLAPQPGAGWAFTHACCACNILRNLAMESRNHSALLGELQTLSRCGWLSRINGA